MATPEEIKEALSDRLRDGIAESQISDRRERYYNPKEMVEGLKALQDLNNSESSPIIRVSFTGRHVWVS